MTPLADRIIVRPINEENMTPAGIILPENVIGKSDEAIVVAVGSGRWSDAQQAYIPMQIKVNDRVILSKHSAVAVKYNGEELLVVNERDVLVIL